MIQTRLHENHQETRGGIESEEKCPGTGLSYRGQCFEKEVGHLNFLEGRGD